MVVLPVFVVEPGDSPARRRDDAKRGEDARGPRSWDNCAVLGNPYRTETIGETGEFLAAARPLLKHGIGSGCTAKFRRAGQGLSRQGRIGPGHLGRSIAAGPKINVTACSLF